MNHYPSDILLWRKLITRDAWKQSELAEWLGEFVPESTVRTRISHVQAGLNRLENDGFCFRSRDGDDERVVVFKAVK